MVPGHFLVRAGQQPSSSDTYGFREFQLVEDWVLIIVVLSISREKQDDRRLNNIAHVSYTTGANLVGFSNRTVM